MKRQTRQVWVGTVPIGGGAAVSIQSMCNTDTRDVEATVRQIDDLAALGCQIVRVAVPDAPSAAALGAIRKRIGIPLVADIHFDYKLALLALEQGVDKLRINPGNIGGAERVRAVAQAASERDIPIRIGVNGGSLSRQMLRKYGGPTAEAMVESALAEVGLLETFHFENIVISLKGSSVPRTVEACRQLARRCDYPLHIGVTEAGAGSEALIKSAVGVGALLLDGIGDTVRVSITGDPLQEIGAAEQILRAAGVRDTGIQIISCPTCARTGGDILAVIEALKRRLPPSKQSLTVAVMGCAVNGPGEAREADLGAAFGPSHCVLFVKGEKLRSVPHEQVLDELLALIDELLAERSE